MEVQASISLSEKRELYEGHLKRLRNIDLGDPHDNTSIEVQRDVLQLATDISTSAFPVFEEFGKKVYASSSLAIKAFYWRSAYYEIGRYTIMNNPHLFFGYLQTKIAWTLRDLNPSGDLETTIADALNSGITAMDIEKMIQERKREIEASQDTDAIFEMQRDLAILEGLKKTIVSQL
ncbi:MAG: hypothetical protein K940chlam1_00750 [Candidatus Anoxychlamydiales bacterium]|nr:hypothetical protein [Candidatus Anoxychlamydiales bacterium]NGX35384.1 hypothetical protein [Candidatus Anoxychlamydiales bacterium]